MLLLMSDNPPQLQLLLTEGQQAGSKRSNGKQRCIKADKTYKQTMHDTDRQAGKDCCAGD